jgi:hypothetical protein
VASGFSHSCFFQQASPRPHPRLILLQRKVKSTSLLVPGFVQTALSWEGLQE